MNVEFMYNDTSNARMLVEHWKDDILYVTGGTRDRWYMHDSVLGWHKADRDKLTKPILDGFLKKRECVQSSAEQQELLKMATQIGNSSRKTNMLREAQSLATAYASEFDNQPTLIACRNCIVDCANPNVEIQFTPSQRHLKRANAVYDRNAECPRWMKFLDQIFSKDTELIHFLQVWFGYCAMGLTEIHKIPIFYGTGRNGKGTLLNVIGRVLGDYAKMNYDPSVFLSISGREKISPRYAMAIENLRAKRFVISSEINEDTVFNPALLKVISGGDWLEGGKLFNDTKEFRPTHKVNFRTNYLPVNNDKTISMGDRIWIVPLNQCYTQEDILTIGELEDELFEAEASGILLWAIRGAAEYLKDRKLPAIPTAIREATDDYLDAADRFRVFIRECLMKDVTTNTPGPVAYDRYTAWCSENGEPLMDYRGFPGKLRQKGVTCTKKNDIQTLISWKLKG